MAVEDRTWKESNLCSLGPRPQIMTGLFLLLLREHFSTADNIEHKVFRTRLWRPNAEEDEQGVMIEDANVWTPTRAGKRPAIFVRRNDWTCLKRGTLDSFSGATVAGDKRYTKLWRGSHTLFAIAPEGGETEVLTAETYRFLVHFGPIFRKYFKLLAFDLLSVGALHQIEEATRRYAVPITIGYGWGDTWLIYEHAPPLKNIRLSQIFETYYGKNPV